MIKEATTTKARKKLLLHYQLLDSFKIILKGPFCRPILSQRQQNSKISISFRWQWMERKGNSSKMGKFNKGARSFERSSTKEKRREKNQRARFWDFKSKMHFLSPLMPLVGWVEIGIFSEILFHSRNPTTRYWSRSWRGSIGGDYRGICSRVATAATSAS